MSVEGRARHSVRAALCQPDNGAHGVARPTSHCQKLILIQALMGCLETGGSVAGVKPRGNTSHGGVAVCDGAD
jgi:hypothetical protein